MTLDYFLFRLIDTLEGTIEVFIREAPLEMLERLWTVAVNISIQI